MENIKEPDKFLVANVMETPDGTILISHHRHDFVKHTDKNGKEYFVDGGKEYFRRSEHGDERTFSVYSDDKFEIIREYLYRGGRGVNGDQPLKFIALKNMSNKWIEATIQYTIDSAKQYVEGLLNQRLIEQENYDEAMKLDDEGLPKVVNAQSRWYISIFKKELVYRQIRKIVIKD